MIEYTEDWLISLLFKCEGSIIFKAGFFALPATLLAIALVSIDEYHPSWREDTGLLPMSSSTIWSCSTAVLISALFFRANAALRRFWEGTGLLHQMRGEWFDAVSCCVTFSRNAAVNKGERERVTHFRHTLVRLMSLCHGSALEEIKCDDESDVMHTIDVGGLDFETLKLLTQSKANYEFNRVEMILHLIQTLITSAMDEGVLLIPPPILSRVYQTLSRGFVNLLNAKKITDTRFPFPLAQLLAGFLFCQVILTPLFCSVIFQARLPAAVFTFLPVFATFAVNLISSELENPFGNDANDLPLDHFQYEMNKCLLMLLQPGSDHVPKLSDDCTFDFDKLVLIPQAVRVSNCHSDKEAQQLEQERHRSRFTTSSSFGSKAARGTRRSSMVVMMQKVWSVASARQSVSMTTSMAPNTRRMSLNGLVEDLEAGGKVSAPVPVNPRDSSGRTSLAPTTAQGLDEPSQGSSSFGRSEEERQSDDKCGQLTFEVKRGSPLAQAKPSEDKLVCTSPVAMAALIPQPVIEASHVAAVDSVLAESMERLNQSLAHWLAKVEDQTEKLTCNTTALQAFQSQLVPGLRPRGCVTSRPVLESQDPFDDPPDDGVTLKGKALLAQGRLPGRALGTLSLMAQS